MDAVAASRTLRHDRSPQDDDSMPPTEGELNRDRGERRIELARKSAEKPEYVLRLFGFSSVARLARAPCTVGARRRLLRARWFPLGRRRGDQLWRARQQH